MNIGVNRSTKELIGYSTPKNGRSILVTAYAVEDLLKKFKKASEKFKKDEILLEEAYEQETNRTMRETE